MSRILTQSTISFVYQSLTLPLVFAILGTTNVYAETNVNSAATEFINQSKSTNQQKEIWEKSRLAKYKKIPTPSSVNDLLKNKTITLPQFPSPQKPQSDASFFLPHHLLTLLEPVLEFLIPSAQAANVYESITIDGASTDWTANEKISYPFDSPPNLATGPEIYGKYIPGATPVYVFAIKSPALAIGASSTLYLNTDQNSSTGIQPGGVDYSININPGDLIPYLYDQSFALVNTSAVLDFAYSTDKKFIEVAVPASLLSTISATQSINVFADVNDSLFVPSVFDGNNQYTIAATPEIFPVRTDLSKRVGIVYSDSTKKFFFGGPVGEKPYSQLFMSIQHQAMMAGISFDLLTENDLTNLAKLVNYDALIFPFAANIPSSLVTNVRNTLYKAIYKYGIGIITTDNWLTDNELDQPLPGDSYQIMKQLLGITRVNGAGPVNIDVTAGDVTHPAMKNYVANEAIISYPAGFTSYFQPISGQTATVLAYQTVTGFGKVPAVIANTTGGRNVHFASTSVLGDTALAWQALQWVVYGNNTPVALKMGRNDNLFISRNDMDQAQEVNEMNLFDIPLLTRLQSWKTKYNFVGSFYIDIGNDPKNGLSTNWAVSAPLFKKYIALDNEMGTHSNTHPADTNLLTTEQFKFEFNQSMDLIKTNLGSTWRTQNIRGGAVPGAPDLLTTANNILQLGNLDYLSGGWASIGAGFPNAIGYLTPDATKVYFSPNMTFDFTMIEFGVLPVNIYGVPTSTTVASLTKKSATEAATYWKNEIDRLMKHTSQPIIHWPWHDYGPTSGSVTNSAFCNEVLASGAKSCYSVAMYENTINYANTKNSEFATLADVAQRINTFKQAKLSVNTTGNVITANVTSSNVGKFSLMPTLSAGQVIQKVNNWYAYNDKQIFLDDNGGVFDMTIGTTADSVTHITTLPARARLINVTGDGNTLSANFEGEGSVTVRLSTAAANFWVTSDGGSVTKNGNDRTIKFTTFGTHTIDIKSTIPTGTFIAKASAVHSGLCMGVKNGSTLLTTAIVQQTCSTATYQQLTFTPVANKPSVYTLKFNHSSQCADVFGSSTLNGTQMIQYPCTNGLNQQFKLVDKGNGTYNLIAQHSNKLADVFNASLASGANIVQWPSNGGNNQKWLLSQF